MIKNERHPLYTSNDEYKPDFEAPPTPTPTHRWTIEHTINGRTLLYDGSPVLSLCRACDASFRSTVTTNAADDLARLIAACLSFGWAFPVGPEHAAEVAKFEAVSHA